MLTNCQRVALLVFVVLVSSMMFACRAEQPDNSLTADSHTVLTGPTMGTSWSAVIADDVSPEKLKTIEAGIVAELERINALMSTWDPDSALSVFNQSGSTDWQAMHADVVTVFAAANNISVKTSGVYDVTLGPVIDLWGFGSDTSVRDVPGASLIKETLQWVGYDKVEFDQDALRKPDARMRIDLSSIAKGYAVDQIGSLLLSAGLNNFNCEIGGEILTRGHRGNDKPWRIGIELPDKAVPYGIEIGNGHIASSGDYRNYHEVEGERFSHLIDGNSGYPISHNVAAVTVLHDSTMLADGWATALMVLDFSSGWDLANELGLAVQFTLKEGEDFVVRATETFPKLVE